MNKLVAALVAAVIVATPARAQECQSPISVMQGVIAVQIPQTACLNWAKWAIQKMNVDRMTVENERTVYGSKGGYILYVRCEATLKIGTVSVIGPDASVGQVMYEMLYKLVTTNPSAPPARAPLTPGNPLPGTTIQ